MKTETKQWIFLLLTLILGAATSVLIFWWLHRTFSFWTKPDEMAGMVTAFCLVTPFVCVPWAYFLDFVFGLFEIKNQLLGSFCGRTKYHHDALVDMINEFNEYKKTLKANEPFSVKSLDYYPKRFKK